MVAGAVHGEEGAAGRRVVLFDFDGVLVRGDAFAAFMRDRYRRAWWRGIALLPLLPVFALMALTLRGRHAVLRFCVVWSLLGVGAPRYRRLAETFGRAFARDARHLVRAGLTRLNEHRHAGDRVIVVTGCEQAVARAILDELGFETIELVASRLVQGHLGMRVDVHNRGMEKPHQLRRIGVRPPWDVAYSDSQEDLPMLAAARSAVLVDPDRRTLAAVSARLRQRLSVVQWRQNA